MTIAFLISALFLGLASSLHCVGMCGPLVMNVPVQHLPAGKKTTGIVVYQLGRICMYACMGAIAGIVGWRIYAAGWQQFFSVILGALILLMLTGKLFLNRLHSNHWMNQKVMQLMSWSMKQHSYVGMLLMGVANGLLPCGMVYIALTGAMAGGTVEGAILFMFLFGIGTLPALLSLAFWGSRLSWQTRRSMQKLVPYVVALTGILLIMRGLNLNIPYISPFISERSANTVSCH